MSAHDTMLYHSHWKGKTILFCGEVDDLEAYPEKGMMAVLVHGETKHDYWIIEVDYTKFDTHNIAFETSNYFDKNNNPCLSARQAGQYKQVERLYLPEPSQWSRYFLVTSPEEIEVAMKKAA